MDHHPSPSPNSYSLSSNSTKIPRRIARDLVLQCIYDLEDSHFGVLESDVDDEELLHLSKCQDRTPADKGSWCDSVEYARKELSDLSETGSLEVARKNLDRLCEEEEGRVQSEDAYCRAGLEGRRTARDVLETSILKRIAQGRGPRDSVIEDLLAPFRGPDTPSTDATIKPLKETYQQQLTLLQAWNAKTLNGRYGPGPNAKLRNTLLDQLEAREVILLNLTNGHGSTDDIDQNGTSLRTAIHAFRPETASFSNQSPYVLLAALVANTLVTDPDIRHDMHLWELVRQAMYSECRFRQYTTQKEQRRTAAIAWDDARRRNHTRRLSELRQANRKCNQEMYTAGGTQLIDDLKAARIVVYEKVLTELQEVVTVTTGVKQHCFSFARPPFATLNVHCDGADQNLGLLLRSNMALLLSLRDMLHGNVSVTKRMNTDSMVRTRKFGGRDVAKKERAALLAERKEDPRTAEMMMKVVVDTGLVKASAGMALEKAQDMEPLLLRLWEAAREKYQAEYALYSAFGGDVEADGDVAEYWEGARGDEALHIL